MFNISSLHKKIILLEDNTDMTATTVSMYRETFPTRGTITSIGKTDDGKELFDVVLIKPPSKFSGTRFSAISCDGECFRLITHLKTYRGRYLRCTARKCR
ncbi:MAG: hypothetical protein LBD43_01255 [Holosporales bacterium]|jgi:hypothetical protein|nr:hypothetical protein [Holosporales bacterium]